VKLKTWLLSSYLIVMILPLVTAYLLFAWISAYNEDQKVKAFFNTSLEIKNVKSILDDSSLYKVNIEQPEVEQLASKKLAIVLYNQDGFVLYSTSPIFSPKTVLGREKLYEGLYALEQGFRTYSYRQPVFDGNKLVGFFQVELVRDEWLAGVSERSWLVIGIFIAVMVLIYLTVVVFVNRKINRRLTGLKDEMTAFASGKLLEETRTNKDEIGELQQHFYHMRQQINATKDLIEKEQQAKEYMIATISHDLKTPLTSIRAYAESLELNEKLSAQEQQEYRQVIVEKSNFMKQMLDDLLMYTLLQSPTYEMELVEVDGNEFFDMLVSDYGPLCKEKELQLYVKSSVIGSYKVNPKQLMRVADNLMSNAIQHTNIKGTIWMFALSEEKTDLLFDFIEDEYTFNFNEYMYLIVQNNGRGIDSEKIKQVFDPLYQTDEARSKKDARGTGLGLSITKQIIEKHNGEVLLFSMEDIGTCVICKIPKII